jgi:hypothetical protein
MASFFDRFRNGWNAFRNNKDPAPLLEPGTYSSYIRPDRPRLHYNNERSIINAIYNRIAIDVAAVNLEHIRVDENENYLEDMNSSLNEVLQVSANIDQTGRSFIQDAVMSLLDEGCIALVPIDTTIDPVKSDSFEIKTMRVGKIIQWYPQHVQIRVYNDRKGIKEDIFMRKEDVAIVENPLYAIMNEPNSTLRRLIRKLNLMDVIDEESGANKLDLIIQLPYTIKSEARKKQAEQRRKDIEMQLSGSKYGIAYTDGTEKVVQLNRSLENHLMDQVKYLTEQLYGQLGITEAVMNGTAKEEEMLNYYNRTVSPILTAISEEMERKFLSKTARTQRQRIWFFRDPFKLVPMMTLAELADKLTRNEILTSNEFRGIIGYKPVQDDPRANELVNKNIAQPLEDQAIEDQMMGEMPPEEMNTEGMSEEDINSMLSDLDVLDGELDDLDKELR